MRRRRKDNFEELIGPIAVLLFLLLFLFGAAILAFFKALILIGVICGAVALLGFLAYRLGRYSWGKQLNVEAYLPSIDWTLRRVPTFDP